LIDQQQILVTQNFQIKDRWRQ